MGNDKRTDRPEDQVVLRKNPYPFEAMLAICSDLDETESVEVYFNTAEYLNSNTNTKFGRGVNLEVGNTIYFYMPAGAFSYWNASDGDRAKIRQLIKSGHIDCFHSYGDLADTREQAGIVLDHLNKHDCKLRVWVDHGVAKTNFGGDIMQGIGDVPGSRAYHADLTLSFGVSHVWMGRVTRIAGQDAKRSFESGRYRHAWLCHPGSVAKEVTKVAFAHFGSKKYAAHRHNRLVRRTKLRDGNLINEFIRSNPNIYGVSVGDNAKGIASVLTPATLDSVVRRGARTIVYTHLGKKLDPAKGFCPESRAAFELLGDYAAKKKILVTTTSRLLNYVTACEKLSWKTAIDNLTLQIRIDDYVDCATLQGVSFQIPKNLNCEIIVNSRKVDAVRIDSVGDSYAMLHIPWEPLQYAR